MSVHPGIEAMDPFVGVPEGENPFADLAEIVLRDDTQDLPFGTGIVTPEFPGGNAPLPHTDLNVALGLVDDPFVLAQLQGPPASSPSGIAAVAPFAFFVFAAFVLLRGFSK